MIKVLKQAITVECSDGVEFGRLLEWIDDQTFCTVEFNTLPLVVGTGAFATPAGVQVEIMPHYPEMVRPFEQFCEGLRKLCVR